MNDNDKTICEIEAEDHLFPVYLARILNGDYKKEI